MDSINDEWEKFISSSYDDEYSENIEELNTITDENINFTISDRIDSNSEEIPKATEIYISTKSKIAYLNREIDLKEIFWNIPIVPYAMPKNGVIKKQIKFNSTTQEEVDIIQENLKNELYFEEQVLTSINNPNGRIKFKDIRKISVGISKKDIMSYRSKKKSAFYNCFVMILRIKINDIFKEFHIKVFNTGKMEIPGIQNHTIYDSVLSTILTTLQPHIKEPLNYLQKSDTVLINSNFNCGYYISREVLFDILKQKYNIQCIYDPCSYPGIQCKFYYNPNVEVQNTTTTNTINNTMTNTNSNKNNYKPTNLYSILNQNMNKLPNITPDKIPNIIQNYKLYQNRTESYYLVINNTNYNSIQQNISNKIAIFNNIIIPYQENFTVPVYSNIRLNNEFIGNIYINVN
jgi:hypothetical protein